MASSKMNYHVFLSFRGTDVRNNFLSHLYAALDQEGIYTFVDSEELRKGEQISPLIMRAIEESRIAIIIFSEDYASSWWCLEELVKIMECKAQNDLIVFPVFYKVEPREVRGLREGYGTAMAKHETKYGKDSETVKRWKKALFDAGSLSGWAINDGDEAELIQRIVNDLSIHLGRTPFHVAKYPVGIDSRVQEVISLSQKESDGDDVLMIGLWGPGGIGKTTIAKAIYNAIERQFQGSSFLAQVREVSNQINGLVKLQEKLLSEILSHRQQTVYSVDRGISLIRERLCWKKVLLILDDVDQLHQLNALAGGSDWFGKGSRIFITSRDKRLLTSHGINHVYEVQTLKKDEALGLFVSHAFRNCQEVEIRKDLIDRALHYASGLPLALEVLGSFLRGRTEPGWESVLHRLSKWPDETINRVLKISFDGLDDNEREIFLDIACFFKGKSIQYVKKVLDSCDYDTTIGIEILISRSLIRNENGTLQMHDLVQLMGKVIVNRECPDNPGRCSRLWLFEDVVDILREDTGTNAVKAIVVDSPAPEEITISHDAFANMKALRMLILLEVHFSSRDPVRLPNNLRWLKWSNAPPLEFGSGPKKLVGLDVQFSHIRHLGGNFKNFKRLKYINFSHCKSLVSVPDISSVPNLESLYLKGCNSLEEIHQSIGYLDKLKFLCLHLCSNLSTFPNTLRTKSLQTLDLFGCSKLEKFPDIPGKMEHLEELNLERTAIKELPTSVENLLSVKKMQLRNCKNLTKLPSSIYKLQNLEHLSLQGCTNLVMFPKNFEDSTDPNGNPGFPNLRHLELNGCNLSEVEFLESSSSFPRLRHLNLSKNKFSHLSTHIQEYNDLEYLNLDKCKQLKKIPQLPPNVRNLSAKSCLYLEEFPDLSSLSCSSLRVDLSSCRELFLKGANMADLLPLKELPKMRKVDILLNGREMPEWFLHCKDGSISFMVSQDSYDKFLGLALCFVFGPKKGKAADPICVVYYLVNCREVFLQERRFNSMKSDHVWITYLPRSELDIERELLRDEGSHFQVCLRVSEGRLKQCGFRLICEQQEDDLRFLPHHQQPMERNWPLEERDWEEDNWIDTEEEESSSETDDELDESNRPRKRKRRNFRRR